MRRPFATFEQVGGSGVIGDRGKLAQPNHMEPTPARRPFATLVQISDSSAEPYCTHRFYNETGRQLWKADHGSRVNAVTIAGDGSVYTAGEATDSQNTPEKCYRLIKWSARGGKKWGIKANGQSGYDVSIDSEGNVWLAAGAYLEKYSPSGTLLLQLSPIPDPWQYMPDGIHFYSTFFQSVTRVLCSTAGVVFWGTTTTIVPKQSDITFPLEILSGNTCELNGGNHRVFYNILAGSDFYGVVRLSTGFFAQDADGNVYNALVGNNDNTVDMSIGYTTYHTVNSPTAFYDGLLRPPDEPKLHSRIGLTETDVGRIDQTKVHRWGSSAICLQQSTSHALLAWGENGIGAIKDFPFPLPYGSSYLNDATTLIEETAACYKGVLRCNDSLRYVYGLNDPNSRPGCTHRIRDYPSTFVWEGNHKGTVYDARITNTGRVLVGGDRVYDP